MEERRGAPAREKMRRMAERRKKAKGLRLKAEVSEGAGGFRSFEF